MTCEAGFQMVATTKRQALRKVIGIGNDNGGMPSEAGVRRCAVPNSWHMPLLRNCGYLKMLSYFNLYVFFFQIATRLLNYLALTN